MIRLIVLGTTIFAITAYSAFIKVEFEGLAEYTNTTTSGGGTAVDTTKLSPYFEFFEYDSEIINPGQTLNTSNSGETRSEFEADLSVTFTRGPTGSVHTFTRDEASLLEIGLKTDGSLDDWGIFGDLNSRQMTGGLDFILTEVGGAVSYQSSGQFFYQVHTPQVRVAVVPEPKTYIMFLTLIIGASLIALRKRKKYTFRDSRRGIC